MFTLDHLHPIIVHFPIALLLVGLVADLFGHFAKKKFFSKAGLLLLLLGTAGTIAAFLSGDHAGEGMPEIGSLSQAVDIHEEAAELTLWLAIITSVVRLASLWIVRYGKLLTLTALGLFLITAASVARTGYYGGELVYKHAAGVQLDLGLPAPAGDAKDSD